MLSAFAPFGNSDLMNTFESSLCAFYVFLRFHFASFWKLNLFVQEKKNPKHGTKTTKITYNYGTHKFRKKIKTNKLKLRETPIIPFLLNNVLYKISTIYSSVGRYGSACIRGNACLFLQEVIIEEKRYYTVLNPRGHR